MPKKIGIVLALDGEQKFAQGMRNAQQASKQLDGQLRELKSEFKDSASSMEFLTKKQDLLKQKEEAYQRTLTAAKTGQSNAKKAYKEQAKALEDLERQLQEAREALSRMSNSDPGYAKQVKEVEKLSAAVDKQTTNYLKAEGRLSAWDNKVNKAQSDIVKNSRALEQNSSDMKKASSSTDDLAKSMGSLGNETSGATKGLAKAGEVIKNGALFELGAKALEKTAQAAKEAAKYVVEVGSDFEKSMSEVKAISGATGASLDKMSQKARKLGSTTKFSATEVANGFKYMSLAGWDTDQMLSSIDGIVNLAAASEMELAEASDMVTDYLSAFGLEAEKAGQMADQMAFAQANSNTSVQQLGEAYANCAANLHAAGQDMETVTSILEAMANQGTKGSQAGTALSAMMRDISQKMEDGSITIGKTSIAVQDSEGNFRDLTDILRDVEKATEGMGTAEKTAALQKTFTARSIKAVNQVLTEGVDVVASYEEALRGSEGAAAKMADTMQDNFKGAMTELGSATEGLGIAVYDKIKGPLTDAANVAAAAIGGLTDIITPDDLSPLEAYVERIKEVNDAAESAMTSAQDTVSSATMDTNMIQNMATRLMQLNNTEAITVSQRGEMRTLVNELKQYIPELADAYDEETGSLKLTNEQLAEYIDNAKTALINDAAAKARSGIVEAMLESQAEILKAEEATAAANDEYMAMTSTYEELKTAAENYTNAQADATASIGVDEEAREKALLTMAQAEAVFKAQGLDVSHSGEALSEYTERIMDAEDAWSSASDEEQRLKGNLEALQEQYDSLDETTQKLIESSREETQAALLASSAMESSAGNADIAKQQMRDLRKANQEKAKSDKEAAEAAKMHDGALVNVGDKTVTITEADKWLTNANIKEAESFGDLTEETKKESVSLGELIGSAIKAGEAVGIDFPEQISKAKEAAAQFGEKAVKYVHDEFEKLEDISRKSADNILAAWNNLKEEAKNSLSFDLFGDFNGGTDQTVEEMNAHMQSQIEGLQNYAKNLELVSQHVGKEITPEFMDYLESMGTDGANALEHIVRTFNQDNGLDLIKEWSDGYMETLQLQDDIATALAGDKAALSDGLKGFGSSEADYDALNQAISEGLTNADEEVQSQVSSLAETAKEVGATIPEGLTEAITSGDIDATEIENQLNAAINGAMEGLLEVAKENGANIPADLAIGIEDGTTDVVAAYDTIVAAISESTDAATAMTETAENSFTTPLAQGIAAGQGEVVSAITDNTNAAVNAAKSGAAEFTMAGTMAASGLASGILSGQSQAIAAAIQMARQALLAAKRELDIKSPSKKFKKDVGEQIGKGTAFGIKQSKKLVLAEAENMSSATLIAATRWLKKYKKTHKVTRANEQYFWTRMVNLAKAGTAAYDKAVSKLTAASFKNKFGVSKTKTTGSGKNKKTVKKDAETYYGEIYSAAQDYFEMLTMYEDMSFKDELKYWQKVQKTLKKGTSAYIQATTRIKELKKEIGTYSVASDLLNATQTYVDMSEKAVTEYWDIVRRQYKVGTEDRLRADEQYYNAKKSYTEKLKSLEDDYLQRVEDANKEYRDAFDERVRAIKDAYDLFDAFESESVTGEELLFNIQSQAAGYKFWSEQLDQLRSRGVLSDDLLRELTEKGPGSVAGIVAINQLSDQQLRSYQKAYEEKTDAATRQATKDTADLKRELTKKLQDLETAYNEDTASVNATLSKAIADAAANVSKTLAEAVPGIAAKVGASAAASSSPVSTAGTAAPATAQANTAASAKTAAPAASPGTALPGMSNVGKALTEQAILNAVKKGTKHKKSLTEEEKKSHHALWEHLVTKYGYTGKNSIYKELAGILGITVSDTVTSAQKDKILAAMKKKGYRSGSRYLTDPFAWMDEAGIGSEMVLSRADNAVLTRIPAQSAIVPANLTDNLWQWGSIAPAQMLAQLERRQAAVASYVNQMMGSVASAASMNGRLMPQTQQQAIRQDSTKTLEVFGQIQRLLEEFLPYIPESNTIVFGDRELKQLADKTAVYTGNALAARSKRTR